MNPKLSLFKVTYNDTVYYTLIDEFDRDELAIMFVYYEQTHVTPFLGPKNWLIPLHTHFIKMFKLFELFQFEGLPLYAPKHINEIWALLKSELNVINKACENL